MRKKKLVALGLSLCMAAAAVLTGCGSSGETSADAGTTAKTMEAAKTDAPAADADSQEPVTLTVLAGQSTTDAGIEDFIDAALAEKYPYITLEWECVGWNDLAGKMQIYRQSGMPDIIIGKAQDVGMYAPLGILGAIDDEYLDRGLDAARENVTIDGTT